MNRTLLGYRTMLGLSQSQMGKEIGMSGSNYCKKEIGKSEFRASEMIKIMSIINERFPLMTMEQIFTKTLEKK